MKPRPSYSFSAELPSSSDTTSHSASHWSPGRHAIKLRLLQLHSSFLAIQSGQLRVTVCSASPGCLLPPEHLVVIYLPCRLFTPPHCSTCSTETSLLPSKTPVAQLPALTALQPLTLPTGYRPLPSQPPVWEERGSAVLLQAQDSQSNMGFRAGVYSLTAPYQTQPTSQ